MKNTVTIKDQQIDIVSNALTPILYRQVFKADFLQEMTSFKKLKKKKADEYTDEELELVNNKSTAFTRLAFIMAMQAKKPVSILTQLSLMDFYEWLSNFGPNDFNDPLVIIGVLNTWRENEEDRHVEEKNLLGREPES